MEKIKLIKGTAPKMEESIKFYDFQQSNSGGRYDYNERDGRARVVIIEAYGPTDANLRAQDIGIYFDGVREGQDCGCCGDRWYRMSEYDGSDFPAVDSEPLAQYESDYMWGDYEFEVFVHYLDGRIEAWN